MRERLSPELIRQLIHAAVQVGHYDRRSALLAAIPQAFVSSMPVVPGGSPHDQLTRDLNYLNEAGVLSNGTDPLAVWLQGAVDSAGGVPDLQIFEYAQSGLGSAVQGQLPAFRRIVEPHGASWHPPVGLAGQEAVTRSGSRVPVRFLDEGQEAAASVALISVPRLERGGEESRTWEEASGTGWLIGPKLLITAYHVVNARQGGEPPASLEDFSAQAQRTRVTFGYDRTHFSGTAVGITGVIEHSRELDYVILQLAVDPGVPPLRLLRGIPSTNAGSLSALNVIQHSLGKPKMLVLHASPNTDLPELSDEVVYFTDRYNAASGAPILDDDWHVVAMHRASGRTGDPVVEGQPVAWANVGMRVTVILDDLKQRSPEAWRSIRDAPMGQSRPQLSLVPPAADLSVARLSESTAALRGRIAAVARSYGARESAWIWDKAPISDELAAVRQQLDTIGNRLADAERLRSGLSRALDHLYALADKFAESLDALEERQVQAAQRSTLRREFERAGQSLLDLLERIQEELRLLGPSGQLPDVS